MKLIIIGGGAAGMAAAIEAAHTDEYWKDWTEQVRKFLLQAMADVIIAISMPLLKIIMEKTAVSQPIV